MCRLRPLEDIFLFVAWGNGWRLYEGVKRNTCNALDYAKEGRLCVLVEKDCLQCGPTVNKVVCICEQLWVQ